jgi:DNA-directed RNA polymerase specialized sigma24 family protein
LRRRRYRHGQIADPQGQLNLEEGGDPTFDAACFGEVIDAVKQHPQAEVLLRSRLGFDDHEIGEALGISYEAARKRRRRAEIDVIARVG